MAHSDDGQYELILENKQVLGIFFVAALLCGVFFGLGFLVGRSSKGPTGTQPAATTAGTASESRKSAVGAEKPPATSGAAAQPADTPAQSNSAEKPADAPPPAAAAAVEKEKEKPAPATAAPPPAPAPAADSGAISLQVNVFSSAEAADPVAGLLKRKNFPVTVVPGTTDHYFHVLVGPYSNMKEADAVKKKLEEEGFKPIVKK